MAEHGILRIHRGQAVNTAFVTRLETEQVHLGHEVFHGQSLLTEGPSRKRSPSVEIEQRKTAESHRMCLSLIRSAHYLLPMSGPNPMLRV